MEHTPDLLEEKAEEQKGIHVEELLLDQRTDAQKRAEQCQKCAHTKPSLGFARAALHQVRTEAPLNLHGVGENGMVNALGEERKHNLPKKGRGQGCL